LDVKRRFLDGMIILGTERFGRRHKPDARVCRYAQVCRYACLCMVTGGQSLWRRDTGRHEVMVPNYFVVGIVGNCGFGCDLCEVVWLLWLGVSKV